MRENFWLIFGSLAAGTFAIRISIIAVSARVRISNRTKEIFSFIPASILPAFMAPAVFYHEGHAEWLWGKERLIILMGACVLCYFTRSTLATIAFGLVALYLVTYGIAV